MKSTSDGPEAGPRGPEGAGTPRGRGGADGRSSIQDPYLEFVKPDLGPRMAALDLLVDYHRGEGDRLFTRDASGAEVEVLDFVGGYGANLLGHSHPEIRDELRRALDEAPPFLAQGSRRSDAGAFVEPLVSRLKEDCGHDYVAVLSSTGTEAVNLALLHADLEARQRWEGRPAEPLAVVVLEGSFHGVLLQAVRKRSFPGPEVIAVPWGNAEALEEVFDRERRPQGSRLCAVLVETIQGEGGVRPLEASFLESARKLCRRDGVPLVLDEVQTGMGRTGQLLDSQHLGVAGDYVVLAKAVGGGMTKLGVTLIDRTRWVKGFDAFAQSTFAEDPFSSRAARRTFEILTRDDDAVLGRVRERGQRLRQVLEEVRAQFPEVIREVRGRGLMVGVELHPQLANPSRSISLVDESGLLGYFLSSYLLHVERLRIMPPIASPRVLRLQPSYLLEDSQIERLRAGLTRMCEALELGDAGFLSGHLVGQTAGPEDRPRPHPGRPAEVPLPDGIPKVAFLGHFIQPEHYALWDPSFASFSRDQQDRFLRRFSRLFEPRVFRTFTLESKTGAQVGYVFIGLAQTSQIYAEAWRARDLGWLKDLMHRALDVAREEGCRVVGFGGFTSIVTGNLANVHAPDLVLTTGNSYTVATGIDALIDGADRLDIDLGGATMAVVGALGNIASLYAQAMAPRVEHLVLIGRPTTRRRLERFRSEKIPAHLRERVTVSTSMDSLRECDLVLAATNSPGATILPEHLDPDRTTLICDISIPADCAPEVDEHPRWSVIQGGLVAPPGSEGVWFPGVPLEEGQLYACMAETALLGLDGVTEDFSRGQLSVEDVEQVRVLARRHGFRFLGPKLERSL